MSSLLLDSNILITGERDYYPHDIFPSVWEAVSASIVEKRAIVLDVVYNEIVKGQGWLAEWMKRHKTYVVGTDQQDIVDAYQQVLAFVFNPGNKFTKAAKDAWFCKYRCSRSMVDRIRNRYWKYYRFVRSLRLSRVPKKDQDSKCR